MLETDASIEVEQPRPDHELWLAMQAAHAEWMEATRALEELMAGAADAVPSPYENRWAAKVAEEQRVAFQAYIESRLAFSEYLLSRNCGAFERPSQEPPAVSPAERTSSKLAVAALAVALLCPAAFGLAYRIQTRTHVRDLDAAREAMTAVLNQTPQLSARAAEPAPVQPVVEQPVAEQRAKAPSPAVGLPHHVKPVSLSHTAGPLDQFGQRVRTGNHEFTLASSPHFSAVGPIRVSVHSLDHKRNTFDLSVMLGNFRLERKHVRLREPVWINLGGGSTRVRFVADRIGRNEIHGSITSPDSKLPPLAGASSGKALAESRVPRQQHGD